MGSCKKCLLVHGKKDGPDLVVSSFSKIMIHDRFLDYMYIPPKFAPEIASLAQKKIRVEDTSGREWTVILSYVDGYLSFDQGWHDFALDHGIKLGDLVIVHYVLDSHFVVQIYGRSGCEKLFPSAPQSNQSKRAIIPLSSSVDNGSSTSNSGVDINVIRGNKEGSSKAQPNEPSDWDHRRGVKRKFIEDPCCIIIDRDIASTPKTGTRTFFDLSEFESCKKIPVCGNVSLPKQDSVCADHGEREEQVNVSSFLEEDMIDYAAFEAAMKIPCGSQENDSLKYGEVSKKILPESCPSMSAAKAQTTTLRDQGVAKKCKEFNSKGVGASVRIAEKVNKDFSPEGFGESVKTVKKDHKEFNPKSIGGSGSVKLVKKELQEFNPKSPGVSARIVKKEFMENSPRNFGKNCNPNGCVQENRASVSGGLLKNVKAEVVDLAESPAPRAFTCLVESDDSFLEMAKKFPLLRCRGGAMEVEDKVLVLQNIAGKRWPVFYHKKMGMKFLSVGWKQFKEANGIQTGDQCVFMLKDGSDTESVYQVHVTPK